MIKNIKYITTIYQETGDKAIEEFKASQYYNEKSEYFLMKDSDFEFDVYELLDIH